MKDSEDKLDHDKENTSEGPFSEQPPTPYLGYLKQSKFRKKPNESCKWVFGNDPSRTAKRNLKPIMDSECERCSECVRNCDIFDCPLWQYRSQACKVHRAYLGRLRKSETLSDKEQIAVQEVYEAEDKGMRRVLKQVETHCPSKLRTFIEAYGGKSRASAIKAYEVYQANFDLSMVEPMEGGSQ